MGFKHFLLPETSIVKDEEALLKGFSLESKGRLPKVAASDPALDGLGCEPGNVVEFESANPASGVKETHYRVVVEG